MVVGGYTLHLYCDIDNTEHAYNEFPDEYVHELGSVCRSMARHNGWILKRDNTAICPKCSMKVIRVVSL